MPATREPTGADARDERARALAEIFGTHDADAATAASESDSAERSERLAALFATPPPRALASAAAPKAPDPPAAAAAPARDGRGSFGTARRPSLLGSPRARWTAVIAVLLIALVVAGSLYAAQTFAANAERLQEAVAEYEAEAARAVAGTDDLEAAVVAYDTTAQAARAAADAAAPALAALAGMSDQAALDAANAARQALVDILDTTSLPADPGEYATQDAAALSDVDSAEAATEAARSHSERIAAATSEIELARLAVEERAAALAEAQRALGGTLPATAQAIVDQNPLAAEELGTAVTDAAAAVVAVQEAGGTGDAEMLAYSAAVIAMRDDQTRAQEARETRPAPRTQPPPAPSPGPDPNPAPEPEPQPSPEPVPTIEPPLEPSP